MAEIISFDANNADWAKFLLDQPISHPEFFKTPFSEAGQEYFKKILETINKRAVKLGKSGNIQGLIKSIRNERAINLIYTWLGTYSPFRMRITKNGLAQLEVIRIYRDKISLIDGMTHPFYSITENPSKIFINGSDHYAVANKPLVRGHLEFNTDRPAISDLDFSIKNAKLAFNEFIADRSIENRKKLVDLIHLIPIGKSRVTGTPFIQGGAPGLGKSK